MAVDTEALIKANREAYERGSAPDFPTTVLTEAHLEAPPPSPSYAHSTPEAQARHSDLDIPANINLITEPPLYLDLDNWLYVSDLHIPFHNRLYLSRLLVVARARGINNLVIGGDFFNMARFSKHPKSTATEEPNDTFRIGGEVLSMLAEVFETIYMLPGNHDGWFMNKIDANLSYSRLIWAAAEGKIPHEKIVCTNYDYIYIGPEETGWVVGHPRFFSSIPAKGVSEVALLKRRNVVGAHNHIIGMMQSKDGRFWAIDPGHCTEPELTPYHIQSDGLSKYPAWRPGFLLVQNNIPRIMADGLVDWGEFGAQ